MESLVHVDGISKRFGSITAVDNISLRVDRGEVLGFLGPNGAGKTTTMRIITGFMAPDAGSVTLRGHDITRAPIAAKRCVGYLPEGAPLYSDMTPEGFLGFVAGIRALQGRQKTRRVADTIEKTNIQSVLGQPIKTLSKGFKRRVGLAQAILHDPEILILDEPTDGLDPNQKREIRDLIREMSAQKAIILSTHILEEVDSVCTRAIVIADGKLAGDGTPAELRARSPRYNAVALSVRGKDGKGIQTALSGLPGVASVDLVSEQDGVAELLAHPKDGQLIVTVIGQLARGEGWEVERLTVEQGHLDDVFRAMTK